MVSRGLITPLSVQPGYDQVCHLFFADDILLFMRASGSSTSSSEVSERVRAAFQYIAKSHLFLGRMQPLSKKKISSLTGMSESKFPTTYLGVPLFQVAPKRRFFLPLLDSVRKRLCGWKGKLLSFAGRLVLIKHVLASILVHCFLALPVPRSILKELDKLMRNFLWSASEAKLKANLVNWDSVCKPKSEGGLGLRKMQDLNDACLLNKVDLASSIGIYALGPVDEASLL